MKLQELAAPKPSKQIAKVFESYFGSRISFDRLTRNQTQMMLSKVRGVLGEHRSTTARHTSQQDPKYLQLVMMEQALSSRLREEGVIVPGGGGGAPNPGQQSSGSAPGQTTKPATQQEPPVMQDPKVAAAVKKSAAGQQLNPEEQKMVASAAMMQAESRLRREYRILKESEIQQAQVVLAAQDLVDKMQKMLEDTSELQFKDLPALVDQIKNQIGVEQSVQFNTDATAALSGLVQNLQAARQQLDSALGVVTGQAPAAPAMPDVTAADPAAALSGADAAEPTADIDVDVDAEIEPDAEEPAAALGRPRR